MIERNIATTTHGRYLVAPPSTPGGGRLLVGFHGYSETADKQLERLRAIPAIEDWVVVSVQGLHRFYERRTNEVIASWMTRQDREFAIADNLAYVSAVIEEVAREWPVQAIVFAGFSQGVAMTFRAAAASMRRVAGAIAVGGDVPPEIAPSDLSRVGSAMICRGSDDPWYAAAKFDEDVRRLEEAHVRVQPIAFAGGHDWSEDVSRAASDFLRGVAV